MSTARYDPGPELRRFTKRRTRAVLSVARLGGPDNVSGAKILALFSRETRIQNICGGAIWNEDEERWEQSYEDHGLGQLNEVYNEQWLRSHKGCPEGTYKAEYAHCLVRPRLVPRLTDQVLYCCVRLDGLIVEARKAGAKDPERVGVAGWNCGLYRALTGERDFNDPDHYTAVGPYRLNGEGRGDYSNDVCELRESVIRRWLRREGL